MPHRLFRIWILLLIVFAIYHCPGAAAYPAMPIAAGDEYAVVTATTLNIRSEPSIQGSIVTKAAKGAKLKVLKEDGEWCKVKTEDGKTGWASKQYLDMAAAEKEAVAALPEKEKSTTPSASKVSQSRPESLPRSHAVGRAASFGVLGGVAFSQLAGDNISEEFSSRFGFSAGVLAVFRLNHLVSIQPEILYITKGAVKKSGGLESTVHLDYIDLPILLRINLPVGNRLTPFLAIGPLVSYNIQAIVTNKESDGTVQEITDLKKLDYGVSAGGGLQFILLNQTFLIDARYYLGLAQIHDAKTDPLDLKNSCLSVGIGWMF